MDVTPCPTGKRSWPSREQALGQLAGAGWSRANGNARRQERRAYYCPQCDGWHLTSNRRRKQAHRRYRR